MKRENIGKQRGKLLIALVTLMFFVGASYLKGDDEGKNYVRISLVEKGVTLQRATEIAPETPIINVLLVAGDRLWTDDTGRVECQFENGTILRLNHQTKVDFQSIFDTAASYKSSTILRFWSGSIYLRTVNLDTPDENFQIDTPSCSVYLISEGVFRIDLDEENNTRLSVYQGVAETVSEGESVLVKSGQRCYVSPNEYPSEPESFNTASLDNFDEWNDQREETLAVSIGQQYIPSEATYYISELDPYGAWHYYARYHTHVWRPYYVDPSWMPYTYGRWMWYPCGWSWISYYSWGGIPFHYGWWDWTPLWGWVWIPGAYWSPGWVYWAVGPHYIGWTPYTYGYWRNGIYTSLYKYNYLRYNNFDSRNWTFIPRRAIANPDIRKVKFSPQEINKLKVAEAQFYNPQTGSTVAELQRRAMAKQGYTLPSTLKNQIKALPKNISRTPSGAKRAVKGATTRSTTQKGKVIKLKTPPTSGKNTSVTRKGKVTPTLQQQKKTPTKTNKVKTKTTTPPPASNRSSSQAWKGRSSSPSGSSSSKQKVTTSYYSQLPKSSSPSRTPSLSSRWPTNKSVTSGRVRSSSSAQRSFSSPSSASRYRTYSSTLSRNYSPSQPRYRVPSSSRSLKSFSRPSYSSPSIRGSGSFRSFSRSPSIRSGSIRSSIPSRSVSSPRSSSVRSGSRAVKRR